MYRAIVSISAILVGLLVGHFLPTILVVITAIIVGGVIMAIVTDMLDYKSLVSTDLNFFMFLVAAWITKIRG